MWGKQLNTTFNVQFDASKTIEHEKDLLAAICHPEGVETEVGYDRRTFVYPLKVNRLELTDSKKSPCVQIADVVGSSIAYLMREHRMGRANNSFADKISDIVETKEFEMFYLFPELKVTPEELKTVGPHKKDPKKHVVEMLKHGLPEENQQ